MAQVNTKDFSTLPVGRLGLIPLQSCSSLGAKVNDWLVKWRAERQYPGMDSFAFEGYSAILTLLTPRLHVSAPVRVNAPSTNLSAVMIST